MPTRREWERREKQRRAAAEPSTVADDSATASDSGPETPPPLDPVLESNPAESLEPKDASAGRADQGVTRNTGAGAGGATEFGRGNKNHPSRIAGKPPGG